jgi:hypothetical protein
VVGKPKGHRALTPYERLSRHKAKKDTELAAAKDALERIKSARTKREARRIAETWNNPEGEINNAR